MSDDEPWDKVSKKPGNDTLEPRRISVPLHGSEAQALTPAYPKMIKRLDEKVELYKLHVKHSYVTSSISTSHFYVESSRSYWREYEEVYNKCIGHVAGL